MRKVDEYIESLDPDRRELCGMIRQLIVDNVQGVEEKLSYRLPFYHYFGMFVFLNNVRDGIDVVFCRGKDLLSEFPQLRVNKRVIMAGVCISCKADIRRLQLKEIILAAAAWNREARRLKLPMVSKKR